MPEAQDPKLLLRICTRCHVAKNKDTEFYATSTQCKVCMKEAQQGRRAANQGILYVVSNPAWPMMFKVGSCKSADVMMKSLQTNSPKQDYQIELAMEMEDVTPTLNKVKAKFNFMKGWVQGSLDDIQSFIVENVEL